MTMISHVARVSREWIRFAFVTLLLFVLVRSFLVEAFSIPTGSMEGTLLVGDFLLVNKTLYGAEVPGTSLHLPAIREPRRGDVVVFTPPHDPGRHYVKRVVGMGGDTLEMRDKVLFLNGQAQEEAYARHLGGEGDALHPGMGWQRDHLAAFHGHGRYLPSRDNWGPLVVPPEKFFVLGDNRDNSEDSRYWGFVGREDILGSPWMVYLSVESGEALSGGEEHPGWFDRVRWGRVGHVIQ